MQILSGRSAVITGASQGLGAEIARHYVKAGANVLICARSVVDISNICRELEHTKSSGQIIRAIPCDVSDFDSIDRMVDFALDQLGSLDILVNNAGIYGPMGRIDQVDWKDWISAIETNLFGLVYACRAVFPHFREQNHGKIINLSGGGATSPLPYISAYAASKAAVVRMTETLAEEGREFGIEANAVAPGALKTRLLDEALGAGPDKIGHKMFENMKKVESDGGTPLKLASELCVWLGSSKSDGITGRLISAVWDPWSNFQDHRDDIDDTDVYTLRRIVPADRGKDWGN